MAGSIYKCLKFTAESEEDSEDGKVPMLDVCVWAGKDEEGKQTVYYEYYEKKVTSSKVIMKRSAVGEKMKRTVLSQEIVRRMRNRKGSESEDIREIYEEDEEK